MSVERLSKDVLILICKFLDVKSLCNCFSRLNKKCLFVAQDWRVWRFHCLNLVPMAKFLGSFKEEYSGKQWKDFYKNYLPTHIEHGKNFVKAQMLTTRLNLSNKNKNFLMFYLYIYYNTPDPSTKQIVTIPIDCCEFSEIDGTIHIHKQISQQILFFYGQFGWVSTIELVAVDRSSTPNLKILHSTKSYEPSPRESGFHFKSLENFKIFLKLTTIGSKTHKTLSEALDLNHTPRIIEWDIPISMRGNTEYSDTLQQMSVPLVDFHCGEIVAIDITCPISDVYSKIFT